MDRYKKYYGLIIFLIVVFVSCYGCYSFVVPKFDKLSSVKTKLEQKQRDLEQKQREKSLVQKRLNEIKDSNANADKRIYAPLESDLGNDTLFFTLYSDVIEMFHANSMKIKAIDYKYNPEGDEFVMSGKDYFVFDVNVKLVSNYTNLGKLLEGILSYPYYIKINELTVKPYQKDKKILLSDLSIRLYAHTEPDSNGL